MTKYYVYLVTDSKGSRYEFVPDPDSFALVFDARTTEFTGVMIEAETPIEAFQVYNQPTSEFGQYYMIDEPSITAEKRSNMPVLVKDNLQEVVDTAKEAQKLLEEFNLAMMKLAVKVMKYKGYPDNLNLQDMYLSLRNTFLENTDING